MSQQIRFILVDPTSTTPTPIQLKYQCPTNHQTGKKEQLRYSAKINVLPANWDSKNYRAKHGTPGAEVINSKVSAIEKHVGKFLILMENEGFWYREELKAYLDKATGKVEARITIAPPDMMNVFQGIIDSASAGSDGVLYKSKRYSKGTIKNWQKMKNTLNEYNPGMYLASLNKDEFGDFMSWCNEKGFAPNYVGELCKNWKTLLEIARGKKLHSNDFHLSKDFTVIRVKVSNIDLTEQELEKLVNVDLKSDYLSSIRDFFLLMCETGLRISDASRLNKNHIKGNDIVITPIKTKGMKPDPIHIPISPLLQSILDKYEGFPGKNRAGQYYEHPVINREIKKIAELAGITEEEETEEGWIPRWKLITAHTARRTAITMMWENGLDVLDIKHITGLDSKTITDIYIKTKSRKNALKTRNNEFFNKKLRVA